MPEELNSLNPYSFESVNFNYKFITSSGVHYSVYFVDAAYLYNAPELNKNLMSFGFFPNENKVRAFFLDVEFNLRRGRKMDERIRDTIIVIISDFLCKYPLKSIISICDNADARESCRYKLFNTWYRQVCKFIQPSISKYDIDVCGAEAFYGHASLILRNDNPSHEQFKQAFLNISSDLVSKGY